jgi:hypothetical protein
VSCRPPQAHLCVCYTGTPIRPDSERNETVSQKHTDIEPVCASSWPLGGAGSRVVETCGGASPNPILESVKIELDED